MTTTTIYSSPLCSCVICHKIKSAKGIHSHFVGSHGTDDERAHFNGKGGGRSYDKIRKILQEKSTAMRFEYNQSPVYCQCCGAALSYEQRQGKFCSRSCSATIINKERDYSVVITGPKKGYDFQGRNISSKHISSPYTKIYQCCICQKWFPGSRKVCDAKACRYENIKGKVGGFRPNSTRKHREFYNGFQMDSGAELSFAKLLDQHNIVWVKNSSKFFTYHESRKYYPDFYLPDFDLWVEVKGKYYYNPDLDPHKWATLDNLEVIWADQIRLPNKVAARIGIEPI